MIDAARRSDNAPRGNRMTHGSHREVPSILPAGLANAAQSCPVEKAVNTIGGRWKMLVLRALFLNGELRFNLLLREIPRISAKELTRNVRELEAAGLVGRQTANESVCYSLTPLGKTLLPVFRELGTFGARLLAYQRG
jgi:DNA-binding HxlR family transcriptional regulator